MCASFAPQPGNLYTDRAIQVVYATITGKENMLKGKSMTHWQSSSWSNLTRFVSLWACINIHTKAQTQQQRNQLLRVIDGGRSNTWNTSWCCLFLSSLWCRVFAIWDKWSSALINFLLEQHGRSESGSGTGTALKIIQNLIWIMVQRD